MLSRHGSRYPTTGANVAQLGEKLAKARGKFKASGELDFLNNWKYQLGHEILVPRGEPCSRRLADAGILMQLQGDKNSSIQVCPATHPTSVSCH